MSSIKKMLLYVFGALIMSMLTMLSSSIIADASTTGTTSDGLEYEIVDGEVTITGYSGIGTSVVIPERISGYEVTTISDYSFDFCEKDNRHKYSREHKIYRKLCI